MKYEDLAKTFGILAEHGAGSVVMDWAEHDEWGHRSIRIQPLTSRNQDARRDGMVSRIRYRI